MKEITTEDLIKREYKKFLKKLKRLNIPEQRLEILIPIVENTAWMKYKLDEARKRIVDEEIVIEYDNGGGQKGIRENPWFKAYEGFYKAYMLGMDRIIDSIPEEKQDEIETELKEAEPKTVLELVRAKRG